MLVTFGYRAGAWRPVISAEAGGWSPAKPAKTPRGFGNSSGAYPGIALNKAQIALAI
jgi:hypothetical protein